jgi:hypothetical protein
MRRLLAASLLSLAILPGLALAQPAPPGAPPPGMPGMPGMGPDMPPPGPGGWKGHDHHWMDPGEMLEDFYAANTTHDGHLTLAQAQAASLKPIVDRFSEIDTAKRGYVTFYDIEAWHLDDMAKHLEAQAASLRAKD